MPTGGSRIGPTRHLDVNRNFDTRVLAAPLFAAAGLEYRSNHYEIGAGDPAS